VSLNQLSPAQRGRLTVGAGVLLLSPDALLILLMDMDQWTVLLFRGAFATLGFLALIRLASTTGGAGRPSWRPSWAGAAIAFFAAVGNVLFVISIRHTDTSVALAIIAAEPMFAALLSRVLIPEPIPRRTWIAAAVVWLGVSAIVAGQPGTAALAGAGAALGASLAAASLFVVARREREMDTLRPQAVGALLTALVAVPFADPASATGSSLVIAIGYNLIGLPLALALILRGPRFLPAPEVGLILLLETILGPTWVWIALGERPALQTALAGILILVTLAVHALVGERARTAAARVEPAADRVRT
jgi:drug/metabolite transporter (DMT)-like permease